MKACVEAYLSFVIFKFLEKGAFVCFFVIRSTVVWIGKCQTCFVLLLLF